MLAPPTGHGYFMVSSPPDGGILFIRRENDQFKMILLVFLKLFVQWNSFKKKSLSGYDSWGTPFQQLKQVVDEPSPQLPADRFSPEFVDFISQWWAARKSTSSSSFYLFKRKWNGTEAQQGSVFALFNERGAMSTVFYGTKKCVHLL